MTVAALPLATKHRSLFLSVYGLTRSYSFIYHHADKFKGAVIKESLRMAAPVATRLPLVARSVIKYGHWEIPPGVSTLASFVTHEAQLSQDPNICQPTRPSS